ncbi:MAG: GH25 family lysozyme [bacterium]
MKWFSHITGGLWLFSGLFILGSAYELYEFGYVRFNYPSFQEYPVQGLDISHHQGDIDWEALKDTPYQFVYIKATEGGDYIDRRFSENWQQAQAIGWITGAYHFFTFCRSGEEQAENFLLNVPKTASLLPPAIDIEFAGNCKKILTKSELHKELDDFISIISSFYEQTPIIYAPKRAYKAYFAGEIRYEHAFWARDMIKEPELPDGRDWLFWQYASNARLTGIDSLVDLNVFQGSEKAFRQFVDDSY